MRYLLLNKDIVWLEFRCERNEYLEVTAREEVWHTDQRPFGYTNLTDFLERRKAPKHRAHIAELLKQYGCQELDGYLDVTHALSLNDTFWVKRVDSPLKWSEVRLSHNLCKLPERCRIEASYRRIRVYLRSRLICAKWRK